ncbi:MAG: carboxylesterase/lipase family protein [Chrysiogenetes bacterium]|nr:carboxylesterase/lipase family protein [Chrysiogenetes bacterium]
MSAILTTTLGKLEGSEEGALCIFRGIPFAQPPVGPLRFRAPQPLAPWSGIRPAKEFGPSAPQHSSPIIQVARQDEDCLYLNVWSPGLDGKKRPVMVWVHGGSFSAGSGAELIYDGSNLASRHDLVVVTINYRLGALGYLYLNEFAGNGFETDANRGLLDQIAALEWVRDNIEAFGGDPENVTVFGESAGAMSIGALLGTPRAKGLFRRAILQSGAAHHTAEMADAIEVARAFCKDCAVSESDPARLLELSPAEILQGQLAAQKVPLNLHERNHRMPTFGMSLIPVIDGDVLPEDPLHAIAAGAAKDVEILAGTNEDEWQMFIQFTDRGKITLNEEGLLKVCNKRTRGHGERIVPAYLKAREARSQRNKPVDLFNAIESDRVFRLPAIRLLEAQHAHQPGTFTYLFTWDSPMFNGELGACHALDIPFAFGSIHTPFARSFAGSGQAVETLAERMEHAWANFARSGNPCHEDLPEWPA